MTPTLTELRRIALNTDARTAAGVAAMTAYWQAFDAAHAPPQQQPAPPCERERAVGEEEPKE